MKGHRRTKAPASLLEAIIDAGGDRILSAASHAISAWSHTPMGQQVKELFGLWYREEDEDEFGMSPSFIEALRPIFQFLYCDYFRVQVAGARNVPAKGPAILVANHAGTIPYDGAMMHLAVFNEQPAHRGVRFLVDDFIYRLPMLRTLIQRIGGVRACHENAEKLLAAGHLIAVFPEGTRGIGKGYDERYRLRPFGRGGFIRLAMRTGVPVVPVAIVGSEEVHPIVWKSQRLARPLGLPFVPFTPTFPWLGPLGLVPLPSRWQIRFDKPVRFDRFRPRDAEDEDLVERHADRIRCRVQEMLDAMLAKRKSIWL